MGGILNHDQQSLLDGFDCGRSSSISKLVSGIPSFKIDVFFLEREADIKREIYLYMLLSGYFCSTKEDPHGSGTYGFRGGNS